MIKRDSDTELDVGNHRGLPLRRERNRRSIRLRGYDYSQSGAYFVTICTQNRECMFGKIVDGEMVLNDPGRMVKKWYQELENKFPDIRCDEYIVMPNHFHGVVVNVGADLRVCPETDLRVCPSDVRSRNNGQSRRIAPTKPREHIGDNHDSDNHKTDEHMEPGEPEPDAHETTGAHTGAPLRAVVQWFKTITTNEYIRGVKQCGWPRFDGKLWQRNYWEHIVRNENELNRLRQYIIDNPAKWEHDRENPAVVGADLRVCPETGN